MNRFDGVLPGQQVLALQLLTAAGRETHTEMWHAFIPRARDAHLLGAIFCRHGHNWMTIERRRPGPKKSGRLRSSRLIYNAPLYPDLIETLILPIGKKADAVSAGSDLVKMIFQLRQGKVFVYTLAHIKRWLDLERQLCNHPHSTQADNSPLKLFSIFCLRKGYQLTPGVDKFKRSYRSGQIAIAIT